MTLPPFAAPPTAALITALVVALALAAALGWFCYRLLVDRGKLLLRQADGETSDARDMRRARGLTAGAYLADFALPTLFGAKAGVVVALSDLVGRSLLLVFLRGDCLFSRAFARELASQPLGAEAPLTVSILVGDIADAEAWEPFSELPGLVLLDAHGQVARLMRVAATPSGYLVDMGRHTVGMLFAGPAALLAAARGKAITEGADAARALTPLPREPTTARKPLPVGSAAPDFTLPTIEGTEWSLAAHQGEPQTLLLSDPSCPPCIALLTELGARAGPGVVIVSRGDAGENRALATAIGTLAPMVLQHQREVARAYHTLETPAAFHIDARGKIAAGPAIGRQAVLALLVEVGSGTMR